MGTDKDQTRVTKIKRSQYEKLWRTVGQKPCETGAILFVDQEGVVSLVVFDPYSSVSGATYTPNVAYVNKVIKAVWENYGLMYGGHIHSHPFGMDKLSHGDLIANQKLLEICPFEELHCWIVFSEGDNQEFTIFPHLIHEADIENYQTPALEILEDEENEAIGLKDFSRLEKGLDPEVLKSSTPLVIGAGGASHLLEYFVRTGIQHFKVVDPDLVEERNLVRQDFEFLDIGLPKVDAIETRLRRINPAITFEGYNDDFTKMNPWEIQQLGEDVDVLIMATDSFEAQKYGNLMALAHGIPVIFAGQYQDSVAGEIVFAFPGYTQACPRCVLEPRYQAQENANTEIREQESFNTAFHTTMLDGLIGPIALDFFHIRQKGVEAANILNEEALNKNLIQMRFDPAYGMEKGRFFYEVFGNIPYIHCFETVWHEMEPRFGCPDCGGFGDLEITRQMIELLQDENFQQSPWLNSLPKQTIQTVKGDAQE